MDANLPLIVANLCRSSLQRHYPINPAKLCTALLSLHPTTTLLSCCHCTQPQHHCIVVIAPNHDIMLLLSLHPNTTSLYCCHCTQPRHHCTVVIAFNNDLQYMRCCVLLNNDQTELLTLYLSTSSLHCSHYTRQRHNNATALYKTTS